MTFLAPHGKGYASTESDATIAKRERAFPPSERRGVGGAYLRRDVRRAPSGETDVSHIITSFEREVPRDYFDGRVRALTAGAPFTDAEIEQAVAFESWASDPDEARPAWTRYFLIAESGYIVADRHEHGESRLR